MKDKTVSICLILAGAICFGVGAMMVIYGISGLN